MESGSNPNVLKGISSITLLVAAELRGIANEENVDFSPHLEFWWEEFDSWKSGPHHPCGRKDD